MDKVRNIYNVMSGEINETVSAVDNPFIRQLSGLAVQEAKDLRIVSFVLRDMSGRRSQNVLDMFSSPNPEGVIDICQLTPLTSDYESVTLMDEVAQYRADMLNFQKDENFWSRHKEILFVDYLLACSLCYVEIFNGDNTVDKFFATRNKRLAMELSDTEAAKANAWSSYLQVSEADYQNKMLKVLKLQSNASGYKVTKPRSAIDFNTSVKVTPVFLMYATVKGVWEKLLNNVIKFTYVKDNLMERELISTLSIPLLAEMYGGEGSMRIHSNMQIALERGYIKIPEYGLSKYDKSGNRALNLSRITKMEIVEPTEIDRSFINVDLDGVLAVFKSRVFDMRDIETVRTVSEELIGQYEQEAPISELKHNLVAFADTQVVVGTTTAKKRLHKFMIERPNLFPSYTGEKVDFGDMFKSSFNLGVVE